ncbi:hypothetical protein GA0116948_10558 [Chitinophaga costaii]|uniref:DUF4177 domain-containing protein n=1 Tax=Chitinophaga costaii TaxID=1335309 RepID=A0A1C4D3Z4_9BACT|nr:hypothetical protein [Chitinophaga costaii]PUZ24448.1 hypothetical protein DCM91_11075 [Chitinophaga costaii]SCC26047.1 hypothetical protein GA0116948_10558 [Chitinophaga costaii]
MQKIIIVTLLLDKIQPPAGSPDQQGAVLVNELPQIDALLAEGWQLIEYKVLHHDTTKNALLLSVLLDDGADPDDPLYEFDEEDLDLE